MKINGANNIQGIFRSESVPYGAVYTPGDLVIKDSILYTCLGETSESPNLSLGQSPRNWEYYLNTMSPVTTAEDSQKPEYANRLVTAKVLEEVLSSAYPGISYTGELKPFTEGLLSDIVSSSKFELRRDYLLELKNVSPSEIPADIDSMGGEWKYIVTTQGMLNNEVTESATIFYQEFVAIHLYSGRSIFWTRTGQDLSSEAWVLKSLSTNVDHYIQYNQNLASEMAAKKSLYDGFLQDVISGEYKLWRTLSTADIDLINVDKKITLTGPGTPFQSGFFHDRYYKIYVTYTDSGILYKDSIEVSPEDHTELQVGEVMKFSRLPSLELNLIQSHTSELTFPASITVTSISESYKLTL